MKKLWAFLVLIVSSVTLLGCDNSKSVVAEDLMHHRFVLIKANDQNVDPTKQLFIEFGEHLTVNGKMCNQFFGQTSLENSIIKSPGLAMTEMLCGNDDQLNQLDVMIVELFKNGATVKLNKESDKTYLQLKDKTDQLTFELKDLM